MSGLLASERLKAYWFRLNVGIVGRAIPKGPCRLMVYRWALKGLPYHDFGAHAGTKTVLGPLHTGEEHDVSCNRSRKVHVPWPEFANPSSPYENFQESEGTQKAALTSKQV